MAQKIEIQSVMTLCPHSIGFDQTADLARDMMRNYGVRHLPVQQAGKLVGIVSDRDIKFALAWAKGSDAELSIEDVCTPEPYIVPPTGDLAEISAKMAADKIGCALIVAGEKLVGIFTTADACRVLSETLKKP